MHEEREDFLAARKAHQEVLAIQRKLRGERHWQVADAGLALEGVERLARLEPAERRWLREAEQLNERGVQLYQQGKVTMALAGDDGTAAHPEPIIAYDLLHREPITAFPWESCRTAAERMAQAGVGRLPVVAPEDRRR